MYEACKEREKYDPFTGKQGRIKIASEINQKSDLTEKNFKIAIINIFTELKKSKTKDVKTMSHQIRVPIRREKL